MNKYFISFFIFFEKICWIEKKGLSLRYES